MRCNSRNIRAMLAPLAVLVPVLLAAPASAKDWTVTKVSGEAWVRTSQAPQVRITEGMSIPASASIGTSAGGRVMLERDQGRIRNVSTILRQPDLQFRLGSGCFWLAG